MRKCSTGIIGKSLLKLAQEDLLYYLDFLHGADALDMEFPQCSLMEAIKKAYADMGYRCTYVEMFLLKRKKSMMDAVQPRPAFGNRTMEFPG